MELKDLNYPSFVSFPYHTDRTAYKPFGLPMILVVPHTRDNIGRPIPGSEVQSVRIYVSEKGKSPVAGHDHIGVYKPEFDVYNITLKIEELVPRIVSMASVVYIDAKGLETTVDSVANPPASIKFECRAGIIGTIKYLPDANYIDLSDIKIPTEQLPKNRYILTYEAIYHKRIISSNNELLCAQTEELALARYRFLLNHPGEVLLMMIEGTPGLYFGQTKRSEDSTIEFYRPFSDILQDVHDEQNYLEKANWVYDIPSEHIPYLGFLLGWELPYFPKSVDALRRAVLRNVVKLQKLKGSKRAVRELFDLFGFVINISNIWWTPDGQNYVAPGEDLNNSAHEITATPTVTTEPLIANYYDNGFGSTTVPLAHSVLGRKLTLRAYVVQAGSAAHSYLADASDTLATDFAAYDYKPPAVYAALDSEIGAVTAQAGILGASTLFVDSDGAATEVATYGDAPISRNGVKVNYITNIAELALSRYYQFDKDQSRLFVFATYAYNKINVPVSMRDLQSNRFDVEIVKKDGEQVDPDVVLFLVDFLISIKAFHSLLRKVVVAMSATDTYLTTDFCVGGDVEQDINTDAGQQQTPPNAIIPKTLSGCTAFTPLDYGFRRWDIAYRERILAELKIEFASWKAILLDCAANASGQDRSQVARTQQTTLIDAVRKDEDAPRDTLCEVNGAGFCYLGRPHDTVSYNQALAAPETWRFKGCEMGLGSGVYYTYPNSKFLANSTLNSYIGKQAKVAPNSWMQRLYTAYGRTQTESLHFNTNNGFDAEQHKWLAIIRPSLNIQRDNLGMPGHRLPKLMALLNDFTHSEWQLKPWDVPIECKLNGPQYTNPLNARLVVAGNNLLPEWDTTPYAMAGNGILPDIGSLGHHAVGTDTAIADATEVTQAIYGTTAVVLNEYEVTRPDYAAADGHAAVSLENVVEAVGVLAVDGAGYRSASECGTERRDYSDGYPASVGYLSNSVPSFDFFPYSLNSAELADALDCPTTTWTATLLFKLSSEIKVQPTDYEYDFFRHLRLDCGCLKLRDSNPTSCVAGSLLESNLASCTTASFLAQYGQGDNDQIEVVETLLANEQIGVGGTRLDSQLNTALPLFSLYGNELPASGQFAYKDGYDTIYELTWETGQYLDLTTVTKEPRVWGAIKPTGRLINREIYRQGTITTLRQVYTKIAGQWHLYAEGSEQTTGEFKSTYLCNSPFINPFSTTLGYNVLDAVDYTVASGPCWVSPSGNTNTTLWSSPDFGTNDSAAPEIFWIDPWPDPEPIPEPIPEPGTGSDISVGTEPGTGPAVCNYPVDLGTHVFKVETWAWDCAIGPMPPDCLGASDTTCSGPSFDSCGNHESQVTITGATSYGDGKVGFGQYVYIGSGVQYHDIGTDSNPLDCSFPVGTNNMGDCSFWGAIQSVYFDQATSSWHVVFVNSDDFLAYYGYMETLSSSLACLVSDPSWPDVNLGPGVGDCSGFDVTLECCRSTNCSPGVDGSTKSSLRIKFDTNWVA